MTMTTTAIQSARQRETPGGIFDELRRQAADGGRAGRRATAADA